MNLIYKYNIYLPKKVTYEEPSTDFSHVCRLRFQNFYLKTNHQRLSVQTVRDYIPQTQQPWVLYYETDDPSES